jgi:hypothetical protein
MLDKRVINFWKIQKSITDLGIKPYKPEIDSSLLKIIKDSPYTIGKKNIAQYLDEAYFNISEAALKKSFSE